MAAGQISLCKVGVYQLRRHEALLDEPALPRQTLGIVRERVDEARRLLRAIDAEVTEEDRNGRGHKQ